jgi:hypothetical protein
MSSMTYFLSSILTFKILPNSPTVSSLNDIDAKIFPLKRITISNNRKSKSVIMATLSLASQVIRVTVHH